VDKFMYKIMVEVPRRKEVMKAQREKEKEI
jgi:hypothetical protein